MSCVCVFDDTVSWSGVCVCVCVYVNQLKVCWRNESRGSVASAGTTAQWNLPHSCQSIWHAPRRIRPQHQVSMLSWNYISYERFGLRLALYCVAFQQCTLHNHNEQFFQLGLLDRALISVLQAALYLRTLWCCVSVFKNYTYFALPCRGLGLVRLALYLVDWPTVVLQCLTLLVGSSDA